MTEKIANHSFDRRGCLVLVDGFMHVHTMLEEVHCRRDMLLWVTYHVMHTWLGFIFTRGTLFWSTKESFGNTSLRDHLHIDPTFTNRTSVISCKVINFINIKSIV